jgi:hypothetical protein
MQVKKSNQSIAKKKFVNRKDLKFYWLFIICQVFILISGWYIGKSQYQQTRNECLSQEQYEKDIRLCTEELLEPSKCGKLWKYTSALEAENSRLNEQIQAQSCSD